MVKLFIIADDFTGALDTGVQFATRGAKTRVITDPAADLAANAQDAQVLVMDAETRHLPAAEAYQVVYRAVKQASEMEIPYILKKTDSALRGNIGAELKAVLDATGKTFLPFLPALPGMKRCTVNGIHYINEVPVAESVFGKDPFEPVTESDVAKLIALQHAGAVLKCQPAQLPEAEGIAVYDASTQEDLIASAKALLNAGKLGIMSGCAGLGNVLPELLGLASGEKVAKPKLDPRLLVLCGSVNPITVAQLAWAENHGFAHIHLPPEEKLTGFYASDAGKQRAAEWKQVLAGNPTVIIDANDPDGQNAATAAYAKEHGLTVSDLRVKIAASLGQVMGLLFDDEHVGTLLVTGGDTLLQCMNEVGVGVLEPVCEIYSGVVLSRFSLNGVNRYVISKSGGFGQETLLTDMIAAFQA